MLNEAGERFGFKRHRLPAAQVSIKIGLQILRITPTVTAQRLHDLRTTTDIKQTDDYGSCDELGVVRSHGIRGGALATLSSALRPPAS